MRVGLSRNVMNAKGMVNSGEAVGKQQHGGRHRGDLGEGHEQQLQQDVGVNVMSMLAIFHIAPYALEPLIFRVHFDTPRPHPFAPFPQYQDSVITGWPDGPQMIV
jgi:hypothetical protein